MPQDYQIGALWIGGSLSFLEQLCLKSFVDAGHDVTLFTYGDVENVPDGVAIADGNEILPMNGALVHRRTGSPALQSDLFRYHLLTKKDRMIWADTDAYCVRPFETPNGHFYGWESAHSVNGGVLGLPQDSETLRELMDFTADEYAIPAWLPKGQQDKMKAARDDGAPVHAGDQEWGIWGPRAITHFLHKTGEIKYAQPREALYPISFKDRRIMVKPGAGAERFITPDTYSIHFYGRRMRRRIIDAEGGEPDKDSLIGQLLVKHKVVPSDAPLPPPAPKLEPLKAEDRQGRGALNLTDLANARGIDRGALRHDFTNLYNMLLQPFRQRKVQVVLVGLDGGIDVEQPGAWAEAARNTMEMWLEFLPKAEFLGLDRAPESPLDDPRLTYVSCDLDEADEIAQAISITPDIVIDDATHASHHQQNAFCAAFPKLSAAGLYIIEDLRTQPASLEKQGLVKTAPLFNGYLETGIFEHPDEEAKAELNACRADISGCFVFPAKFIKGRRDQMLVVHKR